MCLPQPKMPEFAPPPPPPAPPPPPPAEAQAETVQGAAANALTVPRRKKPSLRTDRTYNSGAPDSVATGLNIPV